MCYFIVAPIPVAVMKFDIFKFRIFPILLAPRPVSWSNYYYGYGYAPSNTIHKAGIRSARPKISAYGTHGYRGYRRVQCLAKGKLGRSRIRVNVTKPVKVKINRKKCRINEWTCKRVCTRRKYVNFISLKYAEQ